MKFFWIYRNFMTLSLSQIPVAILAGGLATRLRPVAKNLSGIESSSGLSY